MSLGACQLPADWDQPAKHDHGIHLVALSGGADSTAMALAMKDAHGPVDHYLCTPTGNELPTMHAHWRRSRCSSSSPLPGSVAAA